MNRRRMLPLTMIMVLLLLLVLLALISISFGAMSIPLGDVVRVLLGGEDPIQRKIIMELRLPRTLMAVLVGIALAVSGALTQGIFRNPLASPDLMGVSGGASAVAVAFITLTQGAVSVRWLPIVAAAGGILVALLVYVLAYRRGVSPLRLILIGIGMSAAMSALTTFLLISGPAFLSTHVLNWLTGTIYGATSKQVLALLPWVVVLLPLGWLLSRRLDILALHEESAVGLGIGLQRVRLWGLLCGVLLASAAVGLVGAISFVALMAPHLARMLVGIRYKWLIPTAALLGALLVTAADLAGRVVFIPLDLPAGIFTALFGAPFFFYLLFRGRNK